MVTQLDTPGILSMILQQNDDLNTDLKNAQLAIKRPMEDKFHSAFLLF